MEKEKILFFDTKPYDRLFFDQANTKSAYQFSIKYLDGHLTEETVGFCSGYDVVCAFVNDTLNESVIHSLSDHGVKLIVQQRQFTQV